MGEYASFQKQQEVKNMQIKKRKITVPKKEA